MTKPTNTDVGVLEEPLDSTLVHMHRWVIAEDPILVEEGDESSR
eukprot:CAMPEP_0175082996 /NCGR_PEP_ID=MMETSP0052_2-20121109/27088_1 /TAXON_ID=51329 ORGANISM="Polytomella parva, Strain SAG 63-3" /NCGR_SAMPLE_ID=MMETSP0052_2 /ASSEMBLY_ACC=CAM_ASM_000194 /LENGTH=43 /DNA_ID= /DNA_START= /DNA_END= /DNA_ORIENTATION=